MEPTLHTVVPILSAPEGFHVQALQTPRGGRPSHDNVRTPQSNASTPRGGMWPSSRLFRRTQGNGSPNLQGVPQFEGQITHDGSLQRRSRTSSQSTPPNDVNEFLQRQRLRRQKHEKDFRDMREEWVAQRQPILERLASNQEEFKSQIEELRSLAVKRKNQVESLAKVLEKVRKAHARESANGSEAKQEEPEGPEPIAECYNADPFKDPVVLDERAVLLPDGQSSIPIPWEAAASPLASTGEPMRGDETYDVMCGCGLAKRSHSTGGAPEACAWDAVLSERQPIWPFSEPWDPPLPLNEPPFLHSEPPLPPTNPPIPWECPPPAAPPSGEAMTRGQSESTKPFENTNSGGIGSDDEVEVLMCQDASFRSDSEGAATSNGGRPLTDRSPSNLSGCFGDDLNSMASSAITMKSPPICASLMEEPTQCWKLVHNPWFEGICVSVIVVHAAFMGFVGNYSIKNIHVEKEFEYIELSFLMWYFIELSLKIYVHRWNFFLGEERKWNIFDMICVIPVNQLYDAIASAGSASLSTSFLRSLRLLRLVKVLRLIRAMRFFRELRLILSMLVGSLSMLMWTLAMLVLILYIFGIIFLQALEGYLSQVKEDGVDTSLDPRHDKLLEHWGGIGKCMLTLYKSITAGHDWAEVAEPLKATGFQYYVIFLVYIIFLLLAVLNILTGMFCERAKKVVQHDSHAAMMEAMRADDTYREDVKRLFAQLDSDGNGGVTWDEFHQELKKPQVQAYFESLDIDVRHAERLFKALAGADDSRLSAEDFLQGCLKIHGDVRRQDMLALMKHVHTYIMQMQCFMQFVDDSMQRLYSHGSAGLPRASRSSASGSANSATAPGDRHGSIGTSNEEAMTDRQSM